MLLPSTLDQTTLGDLLGPLHRGNAFGTLELMETRRNTTHQVWFWDGLVVGVALADHAASLLGRVLAQTCGRPFVRAAVARALSRTSDRRPLGERLVATGVITRAELTAALIESHRRRLDWLDALGDGRVRFRPLRTRPAAGVSLGPQVFLHGRRRHRRNLGATVPARDGLRQHYATLGVTEGSSFAEIKRAFRQAVLRHHPDLHAHRGEGASPAHLRLILESYERLRQWHESQAELESRA